MLVQMDITKLLVEEIVVEELEKRQFKRKVEYEYVPPFCNKCHLVSHKYGEEVKVDGSKKRKVWKWVPKEKPGATVMGDDGLAKSVIAASPKDNSAVLSSEEASWTQVVRKRHVFSKEGRDRDILSR